MDESRRHERRIGERRLLPPIEVVWDLAAGKLGGPFRRGLQPSERVGRLLDASVTGAAMEAVAHRSLAEGTQLVLEFEGGRSLVKIARVAPGERPGERIYGLELTHVHARLREAIDVVLAEGRPIVDPQPLAPEL